MVPTLVPCPRCGLPIEHGNSPLQVAWHDCDWVLDRERNPEIPLEAPPSTFEEAETALIAVVMAKCRAPTTTPAEVAKMISALSELRSVTNAKANPAQAGVGGAGSTLDGWLNRS